MVTSSHNEPGAGHNATLAGLRAKIYTTPTVHHNGVEGWTTYWQLSWEPIPAASRYLVYYATAEGVSATPHPTSEPQWRLSIATGIGSCETDRIEQEDYLLAAQLQVIIAAQFADGSLGTPSAPIAVGMILT
ncbi:hypothetical protein [Dictyobacter kobayashii]|uniref:Fibronectin type-III domain-containing protein n=1 Tax=Dictyobacter kobayashii TaxID=2014872 RepID=A0A402AZ33_9CHLR|nr:hypothetical protein [Dictyobacter kobayashii]GCE24376.1 hypothetical protein KDK_81760 [Dictyobacter kobayashii]